MSVAIGNRPDPHTLVFPAKSKKEKISITAPATMITISPGVGCLLSTGSSGDTSSQGSQTRRRCAAADFAAVTDAKRPTSTAPCSRRAEARGASVNDMRVGVLASGSGTNLQAMIDRQLPIVVVIADRRCTALDVAQRAGIATELVERTDF